MEKLVEPLAYTLLPRLLCKHVRLIRRFLHSRATLSILPKSNKSVSGDEHQRARPGVPRSAAPVACSYNEQGAAARAGGSALGTRVGGGVSHRKVFHTARCHLPAAPLAMLLAGNDSDDRRREGSASAPTADASEPRREEPPVDMSDPRRAARRAHWSNDTRCVRWSTVKRDAPDRPSPSRAHSDAGA